MRILPDTTKSGSRSQFRGQRVYVRRQYDGFDGMTVSEASLDATKPRPDLRKRWEKVFDAFDKRRGNRPERPLRRPQGRVYVPRDGNQAGPLFGFYDRRTGQRMAVCRGTIHHVMTEAQKFAEAQGGALSDLYVRIEE